MMGEFGGGVVTVEPRSDVEVVNAGGGRRERLVAHELCGVLYVEGDVLRDVVHVVDGDGQGYSTYQRTCSSGVLAKSTLTHPLQDQRWPS
jgi:hypothetical protein